MKILIVTQYFWPEFFIVNDMVKTLVRQGHTVKVLTGKPNYPDGDVFDGYEESGLEHEDYNNASIFRVPLRPRKSGGAKNLFLNYLSFIYNGLRYFPSEIKGEAYDSIIVFAPSPITSALPALYLKYKTKAHLAIWVQDLWPESLKATGFIKNKYLLRIIGLLVRAIYAGSDTLMVQSRLFFAPVSNYASSDKIIYFPNAYPDDFSVSMQMEETNEILSSKGLIDTLENNFCVTFAGNLGTAQSLNTLISAAQKLIGIKNLRIVLVGSGSKVNWLSEQIKDRNLHNVILAGQFPSSVMPEIFSRSQALLVSLNKDDIFSFTIPGKVQAYLASGRPIIGCLDGEGARIIDEAGAGLTCPAEDVDGLVAVIKEVISMSISDRAALGVAGRKYFLKNFEMNQLCIHLIDILNMRIKIAKVKA
ncbi:MAG: glycosyltransferase family 4 protein [Oceanospirillaceae bacterium]